MAETSLNDISKAAKDADLLSRIVSAAAELGISNAQGWGEANARRIVAQSVSEGNDTIASVYAYAVATYNPTPRPGQNSAAVTDAYIRQAVADARQQIEAPIA